LRFELKINIHIILDNFKQIGPNPKGLFPIFSHGNPLVLIRVFLLWIQNDGIDIRHFHGPIHPFIETMGMDRGDLSHDPMVGFFLSGKRQAPLCQTNGFELPGLPS